VSETGQRQIWFTVWLAFHLCLIAAFLAVLFFRGRPSFNANFMDIIPKDSNTALNAVDTAINGRSSRQIVILTAD
jgi:hypothetical protein